MGKRASRRATSAASGGAGGGGPITSLDYLFSAGKPAGIVDVSSVGTVLPTTIISSTTIREGGMTGGSGGSNSHAVMPETFGITTSISVSVTVGSLDSAANNRAVGPGVFSSDGTKGVYIRFCAASGTCALYSYQSGTETLQKTATNVANSGTVITLTATLSGGVWTWTVKKDGGADIAAYTWADSAHVIDLPGSKIGMAFRTQRSGSNYYSRGITRIQATAA